MEHDYSVGRHWVIVRSSSPNQFRAEDVILRKLTDGSASIVSMFTTQGLAEAVASELEQRMGLDGVTATLVECQDAMTDLLSRLKDEQGVTHVTFDHKPGGPDLIPIDVAILRFQVGG